MSDNIFHHRVSGFRGLCSSGTTVSHQHPYSNNQSGYDAQMNGTTGFEGTQRYASTCRAYDDCQQSQGSIQYLPNVVSMRSENAYSSELGIGRQPAQYQQYVSQPQRSFTGTDTPALHMQGHLHARGQLDDQYREIGGQFGPPIEPSGPTQNQQGAWSAERNMQGVRFPFNETPLVRSYETLPVAEGDVRQNPDNVITDISQLESIDSQQQSMFMASLGRRPGYQEELFRAMDNIPLSQMGHSADNRTVGIPPLGPGNEGHSAKSLQLHEYRKYPILQQSNSGGGIAPDIVVSGPGHSNRWDRDHRTSLTPASQPRGRSCPQLSGRAAPSSSPIVTGDALRCSHEGCKAEFNKKWGKGNLARHIRLKHKDGGRCYTCEAVGCESVFQRPDARLKHYRRAHPDLVTKPMMSRKTSCSTGTGSGWEYLGGSSYSHSLASPSDSQALDDFEMTSASFENNSEGWHGSWMHPFP